MSLKFTAYFIYEQTKSLSPQNKLAVKIICLLEREMQFQPPLLWLFYVKQFDIVVVLPHL